MTMNPKHIFRFILIILFAAPVVAQAAQMFDPGLFEKHLKLIYTAQEEDYAGQLAQLFGKVKQEGATVEAIMAVCHRAGLPVKDFLIAAVKNYPAESIISWLIKSSDDSEEIIRIAVFADIDPKKIIDGAKAAGIQQVDAEVMVAMAIKLKREKDAAAQAGRQGISSLAVSPGEELDSGGAIGGGAAGAAGGAGSGAGGKTGGQGSVPSGGADGPVGGTERGVASPS